MLADTRAVCDALADETLYAYPAGNVTLLLDDTPRKRVCARRWPTSPRQPRFDHVCLHLQPRWAHQTGRTTGEFLLPVDTRYTSDDALAQSAISGREFTAA